MPPDMVAYLTNSLDLMSDDVYVIDGPLNVPDLMALYKLERPELKDKPFVASIPAALRSNEPIFDVIKRQDLLVHHPYNSFSTVVDFISSAAVDPDVLAIKMTLYRTGQDSPIVRALMESTERGKQVPVLVELKQRVDEESNIGWARRLEEAGLLGCSGLLRV